MEYQFTKSITGEYHIRCSMGHEVIGRWLQEELGADKFALKGLLGVIAEIKAGVRREYIQHGKEISLSLLRDDVLVEENVLSMDQESDPEGEFDFYNSESSAICGLEDFEDLLLSWSDFIAR